MTYEEFVNLVMSMRAAQKAYFRDRTPANLQNAKTLERSVDKAALDFLEDQAAAVPAAATLPMPLADPDADAEVYYGYW